MERKVCVREKMESSASAVGRSGEREREKLEVMKGDGRGVGVFTQLACGSVRNVYRGIYACPLCGASPGNPHLHLVKPR